ncbi:glucose/quinate/shikimate family membrane-bound PQQ-dependent dehydrogenase [Bradyrhizobium sp. INPA01-394B]|uniref:Glucose/quinate/shikimate family membrane-bound PQQ-dependent dehydrogenase n=1 Tax=Bradyrhizobium campsiandrae TaxID=1729892 RepID=A0ABR7U5V9_9BRAD|nr:glucose/quinate/shikimate family membrane-bound PQQ-dependent dehydrogenase [Bradyrhizobium campsiandrae]MBC9880929.1 glucose/quinate/shikimate family membrane-bound PQQ-dependent dehydrogenase [Bradyrhizobium campsiandrae]MBC9978809.1 glucose/quinate/shikimate family membrane-bound PQQ-dependent dehydrogenase [Bradyrhizobium campsiandrae]
MQRSRAVFITGVVYALIGLVLAGGGVWLAALGGSIFYVVLGFGILATAALLLARRHQALWLFAIVLVGTLGWAISEVQFDWWPLASRGDVVLPMALWLLTPVIVRGLVRGEQVAYGSATLPLWIGVAASCVVLVVALLSSYHDVNGTIAERAASVPQSEADPQPDGDWRAYGRTQFGQRYSPLKQITPDNVSKLQVAWTFRTGDMPTPEDSGETTFEVTPIKVRDTLYLCSQHQVLFALDARTGKERWRYDPKLVFNKTFQHMTCRGVSYHETAEGALDSTGAPAPAECPRRIFLPVNDGRMIALDADSGKPCEGFGDHGSLDLQQGMGNKTAGFFEPTSPPVVGDKILVVAAAVIDNYGVDVPSGVIRGFDVYTGKLIWAWDSGAADENELPSPTRHYTNGSPNSWITASFDPKLNLVYIPTGNNGPDIWGGNRNALVERYSSSIVALDIASGKRAWSYQTVHHDLWDMDVPSQPSLVDVTTAKGVVPAIIQPTKVGNIFVLDRRTGELIVPAPERAVPQGAAPGDRTAPTQPFSELTFRPEAKLTGADMWGGTIFDQLLCRIMFKRLRYEGTFTPPSLQGTLVFPGNLGMFEWGGIAIDPVRQIAIANPMSLPFVSKLIPRGPQNPPAPTAEKPVGSEVGTQPMYGTPFGVDIQSFLSPLSVPCYRPPWGSMAAIDLKTMKIVWQHPNGTIRDTTPLPLPFRMGVPMLGGPITTAGGVAFYTGTYEYTIRAYDVRDGKVLWEDRLPAGAQSTPMSYEAGGKQFVVTAAGGHGSFGTKRGDYVIAYALKD